MGIYDNEGIAFDAADYIDGLGATEQDVFNILQPTQQGTLGVAPAAASTNQASNANNAEDVLNSLQNFATLAQGLDRTVISR